jgi:hypothetical protein
MRAKSRRVMAPDKDVTSRIASSMCAHVVRHHLRAQRQEAFVQRDLAQDSKITLEVQSARAPPWLFRRGRRRRLRHVRQRW